MASMRSVSVEFTDAVSRSTSAVAKGKANTLEIAYTAVRREVKETILDFGLDESQSNRTVPLLTLQMTESWLALFMDDTGRIRCQTYIFAFLDSIKLCTRDAINEQSLRPPSNLPARSQAPV